MPFRFRARGPGLLAAALVTALAAPARAADAGDAGLCRAREPLAWLVPETAPEVPPEQAPTDLEAASVTVLDRRHYLLEGDVAITRGEQRLLADVVRFDQETDVAQAEGQVRYGDRRIAIEAARAEGALAKDQVTLEDVRYQLRTARGNGTAARAERVDATHSRLAEVDFTSCDPGDVDWRIRARELELDHAEGVGRARGMRLEFKGVPLLALPRASFPIDDRRRSGWLYPRIGGSGDGGFDLAVPYYLNLAPNYDATLVPRVLTDRGFMLGGEFRYLGEAHRGEFSGTFLPDDDEAGRDRHSFRFDHWGRLSDRFAVVADINEVSDDRYFEDFGDGLSASATSLLPSSAYLQGRGDGWRLAFGGDEYEVTDPRLPQGAEPYRRLPRLTFDGEWRVAPMVAAGLRSELVAFDKDDALTGNRYDLMPYVAFPVERAAWFLRPELAWRSTRYELDREAGDPRDESPSRELPIASLDAGMFFDRDTALFGRSVRQTLEPRIYYLRVPHEDQDDLPLFDTQELTFSFAQLFRPNRFSGADRQIDANQLTLALSTRLVDDAAGEELLRASIGQIRYFDDQRVQVPGVPVSDAVGSAFAGELDLRLSDDWNLTLSEQWDPESDDTLLNAIRAQYRFGERGVANLAYRYRRDRLEQVDASTAFPLGDAWRLIARWNYSLLDADTLEAFAGVEYASCCWALRVLGRHYVRNVEGDTNNALYVELELTGLGSIGRRTEDFLTRSILGYR